MQGMTVYALTFFSEDSGTMYYASSIISYINLDTTQTHRETERMREGRVRMVEGYSEMVWLTRSTMSAPFSRAISLS